MLTRWHGRRLIVTPVHAGSAVKICKTINWLNAGATGVVYELESSAAGDIKTVGRLAVKNVSDKHIAPGLFIQVIQRQGDWVVDYEEA